MFSGSLSTEINSSSIKNISLLTNIFYDDELIKAMITQLQEDVLKRELLLKEVTKNNKKFIQLNRQIEEEILYIKKAVKLLKENYNANKLKIINNKTITINTAAPFEITSITACASSPAFVANAKPSASPCTTPAIQI